MAADDEFWPEEEPREGPPLGRLTEREREILALIVAGKSNGQIAWTLQVAENTVKAHMKNILRKLGVTNRTEAAVMWVRENQS
jgi:two-component system, NarL family, nitrate/nitrite response regulator NarL